MPLRTGVSAERTICFGVVAVQKGDERRNVRTHAPACSFSIARSTAGPPYIKARKNARCKVCKYRNSNGNIDSDDHRLVDSMKAITRPPKNKYKVECRKYFYYEQDFVQLRANKQ